jgi:uncharacterized protein
MTSDDVSGSKLETLNRYIKSRGSALVALSGGIDSTLLSLLTHRVLGGNAHAITVVSEFYIKSERSFVERFVDEFAVTHSFLRVSVMGDKEIQSNPGKRCYYCKRLIFRDLVKEAHEREISVVFDGTNIDDLDEDRPGISALHELGVVSPYVEANIGKQDILQYATALGLKRYIHPSNTCLATRIPAFTPIREEVLNMVEKAEHYLHTNGFEVVRVRYHEPNTARIEVLEKHIGRLLTEPLNVKLIAYMKELGFTKVSVDMEGYKK